MLRTMAYCLLCLCLPSESYAQGASLSAKDIIDIVIQNHSENNKLKGEKVVFKRRELTYDLDNNGNRKYPPEEKTINSENAKNPIDLERFLSRYNFSFASPAELKDNYAINFRLKPDIPNESDIIYQTANHLEGTIYVNRQHFYVAKFDAKLIESFNKLGGFLRVRQSDITFKQDRRLDLDNIVVIRYFQIKVKYRVFLIFGVKNFFEEWYYEYKDYKLK